MEKVKNKVQRQARFFIPPLKGFILRFIFDPVKEKALYLITFGCFQDLESIEGT